MLLRWSYSILVSGLPLHFLSFNYVPIQDNTGMTFYFSMLTSISAKGSVVPGHIGCIHVYKVNINPEIDTKRNRLMRLDINSEQGV